MSFTAAPKPDASTVTPPPTVVRPSGMPRLMDSVSVNPVISQNVASRVNAMSQQQSATAVQPLSQERLDKYWDKLLENELYAPLLRDKKVEVTSDTTFDIIANNSYFETELKEYKMPILEQLRTWTGIRDLFCSVSVRTEAHEEKIYRPTDKFNAMAEENPAIHELRKLLTEIDY